MCEFVCVCVSAHVCPVCVHDSRDMHTPVCICVRVCERASTCDRVCVCARAREGQGRASERSFRAQQPPCANLSRAGGHSVTQGRCSELETPQPDGMWWRRQLKIEDLETLYLQSPSTYGWKALDICDLFDTHDSIDRLVTITLISPPDRASGEVAC